MENFELKIDTSPRINRKNGRFVKGHKPHNKGIPMKNWMDGRKIKRVLRFLEIPRKQGNKDLPGANRKPIVGIRDGKLYPFDSAISAERILRSKGFKVSSLNINNVLREIRQKNNRNGRYYVRITAGGFRWFYADQPEKYSQFLTKFTP